jgi:hypothetical protein
MLAFKLFYNRQIVIADSSKKLIYEQKWCLVPKKTRIIFLFLNDSILKQHTKQESLKKNSFNTKIKFFQSIKKAYFFKTVIVHNEKKLKSKPFRIFGTII